MPMRRYFARFHATDAAGQSAFVTGAFEAAERPADAELVEIFRAEVRAQFERRRLRETAPFQVRVERLFEVPGPPCPARGDTRPLLHWRMEIEFACHDFHLTGVGRGVFAWPERPSGTALAAMTRVLLTEGVGRSGLGLEEVQHSEVARCDVRETTDPVTHPIPEVSAWAAPAPLGVLARVVERVSKVGVERARAELAAAPQGEQLLHLFDREAAALATWRPDAEPAFALQQLRNRAAACGFTHWVAEAEAGLDSLGAYWVETALANLGDALVRTTRHVQHTPKRRLLTPHQGSLEAHEPASGAPAARELARVAIIEGWERRLVAAWDRGTLRVRDLATGDAILVVERSERPRFFEWSRDGRWIVLGGTSSSGFDGEYASHFTIEVWDVASRSLRWTRSADRDAAGGLDAMELWPGAAVLVTAAYGVLTLWRLDDGHVIEEWQSVVSSFDFSADERLLVANGQTSVRVFDLTAGALRELRPREGRVEAIVLSNDGARIVGVGQELACAWDGRTGAELWHRKLTPAAHHARRAWFLSDDMLVLTVQEHVELAQSATGATVASWIAHPSPVVSVATSTDGHLETSCENECRVWDRSLLVGELGNTELRSAFDVHMSPDGAAAVLVAEPRVEVLRLRPGPPTLAWAHKDASIRCVSLAPDGGSLVVASDHEVWRIRGDHEPRRRARRTEHPTEHIVRSADGALVALVEHGGTLVEVRATDSGTRAWKGPAWRLTFPQRLVDIAFSPAGRWLAAAHSGGVDVFDTQTKSPRLRVPGAASRVAVGDDGVVIAVQPSERARVAGGGSTVQGPVGNGVISPDARWLVSEAGVGKLSVHERLPGKLALLHRGTIDGTLGGDAFDPSRLGCLFAGNAALTAPEPEGLVLWDLQSARRLARMCTGRPLRRGAVSRDGRTIVVTDDNSCVHVLSVRGGALR